jgi:IS605 OrfB family transposase
MSQYLLLDKAAQKLGIDTEDILKYRATKDIFYSEKTDKYNIDSILQTRTMTFGLNKFYEEEEIVNLQKLMKDYASLKFSIYRKLTKNVKFNTNGTNRLHRILAKQFNHTFTNLIADTALADAQGMFQSSITWKEKYEKNLREKIEELNIVIAKEMYERTKKSRKTKKVKLNKVKKGLAFAKLKLEKSVKTQYKTIWFGGKFIKKNKHTISKLEELNLSSDELKIHYKKQKELYKLSRLELFIQGTAGLGNKKININYDKNGRNYELNVLGKTIKYIKIPSAHKSTFTLDNFNRQSSRIGFNDKGKLILNITYSYIKPIKIDNYKKTRGTIGIDIGPKEIAVCFVKNDGNPLRYKHYSIANLLDSRNEEKQRQISLILDQIINEAKSEGFYHITIENLDNLNFKKTQNYKLNRMLSKFPKTIFEDLITSKCARQGIKIKKIHPAYTSIIGLFKYSNRDNLSISHSSKSKDLSAALVVGRRGLGIIEKPIISIRVFKQNYVLPITSLLNLPEPSDTLSKKDWKYNSFNHLWKALKTEYNSVHALTEHICVKRKAEVLDKSDNRYSFLSDVRDGVADILPF